MANASGRGASKSKPTSRARQKAEEIQAKRKADKRVMDEIWAIIIIAIGVFFAVAVFTEGAGKLGNILREVMRGTFGWISFVLPVFMVIFGVLLFARKTSHFSVRTVPLMLLFIFMLCTMNSIRFVSAEQIVWSKAALSGFYTKGILLESGGFIGMLIASALIKWLGVAGCWIFSIVTALVCLLLLINTPLSRFIHKISEKLEERRLIKEHSHLDEVYQDEQGTQTVMNNDPWPEVKRPSKTDIQKPSTVSAGTVASRREEEYIPPSAKAETGVNNSAGKKTIIGYMKDDSLFGRTESGSYGLEEPRVQVSGYGLDGDDVIVDNIVSQEYGTADKEPQKRITNREASEAMLKSEELNISPTGKKYKLPPINLLNRAVAANKEPESSLKAKAMKLEETLRSFNVDASVVQVTQGPTVTRYEIQPAVGVKVAKVVNLADDIALNLRARSIRIEAPIPGKAAIGIEIENEGFSPVNLREIIDSPAFKEAKSKITFAVGKNISGNVIVGDLKAMPHLLIAGSTGSGKSVCINSIITSLLYKATPDEVKMIIIDPKVVELSNYNGIPHLLIPVVTDPTKAAAALNWAVAEMEERYNKFHTEGAKDLETYNDIVRLSNEEEKVIPQIVIVIDELADLMMAASSQVQDSICRIAQKARAAGMHLIVATQRPSVDVLTGVIKANIPSRIAFAVSSHVDSQTILDEKGAEKLLGKGDMLFRPMGQGEPTRIQGCFVSDREVNSVIDYVKSQSVANADDSKQKEILARIERSDVNGNGASDGNSADTDELLMDAMELVIDSGQASVSMLQRRFRIGYNRAARIVDIMEEMGVVGPQDGSRPRQVLMTREEFEAYAENQNKQETLF